MIVMEVFQQWLDEIESIQYRQITEQIIKWIMSEFPTLQGKIAWNYPHLTDHGTFIVSFSTAKKHLALAFETEIINQFRQEASNRGYEVSIHFIKMKWEQTFDESLFRDMINASIKLKRNAKTYWY